MFTGIIEQQGVVQELRAQPGGARLRLQPELAMQDVKLGESVCVSGACLTVVDFAGGELQFDLGEETLKCTTLGNLKPGSKVNLERALRAGDRLGGHFVSGHVDGVGSLAARRDSGEASEFDFEI